MLIDGKLDIRENNFPVCCCVVFVFIGTSGGFVIRLFTFDLTTKSSCCSVFLIGIRGDSQEATKCSLAADYFQFHGLWLGLGLLWSSK